MKRKLSASLLIGVLVLASTAAQAEDDPVAGPAESRLLGGGYLAPMGSYVLTDEDSGFDDGMGGTLALGYRRDWVALELGAILQGWKGGKSGMDVTGITLNGLLFPSAHSTFFFLVGAGGLDVDKSARGFGGYSMTTYEGGIGYVLPLGIGRYDFGIRMDARYRYGRRDKDQDVNVIDAFPHDFGDVLLNVGFQLPLGLRPEPPPPQQPPVAVVQP